MGNVSDLHDAANAARIWDESGHNVAEAARRCGGCQPTSVRYWLKKHKIFDGSNSKRKSGTCTDGDTITVTLPEHPKRDGLRDEPQILKDHGLDPKKLELISYKDNYWNAMQTGGKLVTMMQSTVVAKKRPSIEDIGIILETSWKPPKPRRLLVPLDKPLLLPLFSDAHFPFHEPRLYEASLVWLDTFQDRLREIFIPGDEGDWTPFGRHRTNRRMDITVNEAVLGVYSGLAGWRSTAPNTEIKILPGNHTHWLQARLLELYPKLAGLRRPGEDFDLLSLRSVCKLDELRIDYLDTDGEYHDVHYEIAKDLIVMHGTKTGQQGGAFKEIKVWEGTSVMQGHDHSGVITVVNYRLPGGGHAQRYAVSMPVMARRDLGYSSKQDVAQGFPIVAIWPNGSWQISMAFYDPQTGETKWGDWMYKP